MRLQAASAKLPTSSFHRCLYTDFTHVLLGIKAHDDTMPAVLVFCLLLVKDNPAVLVKLKIQAMAWPLHCIAWHGMAWHGMAWHDMAVFGTRMQVVFASLQQSMSMHGVSVSPLS